MSSSDPSRKVVLPGSRIRLPISFRLDFPPGTTGWVEVYANEGAGGIVSVVDRIDGEVGEDGFFRVVWEPDLPIPDRRYRVRCFVEKEGTKYQFDASGAWEPPPDVPTCPPPSRERPRRVSVPSVAPRGPVWSIATVEWLQRRCFAGTRVGARVETKHAPDGTEVRVAIRPRGGEVVWRGEAEVIDDRVVVTIPIPPAVGGGPPVDVIAFDEEENARLGRSALIVDPVPDLF